MIDQLFYHNAGVLERKRELIKFIKADYGFSYFDSKTGLGDVLDLVCSHRQLYHPSLIYQNYKLNLTHQFYILLVDTVVAVAVVVDDAFAFGVSDVDFPLPNLI